jgi:hypothetical protein
MEDTMTGRQYYDPAQLVRDVLAHLQAQGIDAELGPGPYADILGTACIMLRQLGVQPGQTTEEAFRLSANRPWGDRD